jgi:ABC-type phosphate/phosphonate transport system ATPase subunit
LTREYADRVIGLKHGQNFFDGGTKELTDAVVENIYLELKATHNRP